jgi:hypothetical protein
MFMADGSVQKVGVQWFSHQPKELFADALCWLVCHWHSCIWVNGSAVCLLISVPSPLSIVEWVWILNASEKN